MTPKDLRNRYAAAALPVAFMNYWISRRMDHGDDAVDLSSDDKESCVDLDLIADMAFNLADAMVVEAGRDIPDEVKF